MEESEYINICQLEDTHWWYQGTHSLVVNFIRRWLPLKNPKICDAGCGTGGLLRRLISEGFLDVYGFDDSIYALQQLRKRKQICGKVWKGNVEQIALLNSSFDVITCIDVLYHSNVHKEEDALKEFFRVLKPNGILILQLAAFECLRGNHDVVTMTRKRYRIEEVRNIVKKAKFKIKFCCYRNSWLFPMMFVWRIINRFKVGKRKLNCSSDLTSIPKGINILLLMMVKLENSLLHRIYFPFGTSIFCIARKEQP